MSSILETKHIVGKYTNKTLARLNLHIEIFKTFSRHDDVEKSPPKCRVYFGILQVLPQSAKVCRIMVFREYRSDETSNKETVCWVGSPGKYVDCKLESLLITAFTVKLPSEFRLEQVWIPVDMSSNLPPLSSSRVLHLDVVTMRKKQASSERKK